MTRRDGANSVFDGFCHRPFDPNIDGWLDEMPKDSEFECVAQARSVLAMFEEIKLLRRENWTLRRDLQRERGMIEQINGRKVNEI